MAEVARQLANPTGISHSQIESYHRCPRRWAYQKILKLDPEEDQQALVYGNCGHTGLEAIAKGDYLEAAVTKARESLQKQASQEKWFERCYQMLEMHLVGFCTHYLPTFLQEWEIIDIEPKLDYSLAPGVKWRGFIDLVCRNRRTGGLGIFDHKFSSQMYVSNLSQVLNHSHQLANYTMAYLREKSGGEWPEKVGYIFLIKPKSGENLQNLVSDPSKYVDKVLDLDPRFAQFAIGIENNDAYTGLEMRRWFELYAREGLTAIDRIPANYGDCFKYGSMCGFAKGCHSGTPFHQHLKGQS